MIPRLLLCAALLAPLSLACVAVDPDAGAGTPGASPGASVRQDADTSSTRTPLIAAPTGTGILAFNPGPTVFSQDCLDEHRCDTGSTHSDTHARPLAHASAYRHPHAGADSDPRSISDGHDNALPQRSLRPDPPGRRRRLQR